MKPTYRHTRVAGYIGYIVQAIVNNLSPLLFVTFHTAYGLSYGLISVLIVLNFCIQIATDFSSAFLLRRIGYRGAAVSAHALCFAGLVMLGVLPRVMPQVFAALLISTLFMAVGGGLIEVVVSPMIEALPGDSKEASMALLHSFYCWGQMGVVLLSALYFAVVGTSHWFWLPLLWSLVPLFNLFLFSFVPVLVLESDAARTPLSRLFGSGIFWLLFVLMFCSGACELAMSQWSSAFAETALGLSKTVGDLLGPCTFAALMGLGRVLYMRICRRIPLERWLLCSGILCVIAYLIASLAPHPYLSLFGCALCGFSVAVMWPGIYSIGAKRCSAGGSVMFAFFALAGDVGCAAGPTLGGLLSDAYAAGRLPTTSLLDSGMKYGLLASVLFPALLVLFTLLLRAHHAKAERPDRP